MITLFKKKNFFFGMSRISGKSRRSGNGAPRDRSLFRGWTFLIRTLKVRKNVESEAETLLVGLGFGEVDGQKKRLIFQVTAIKMFFGKKSELSLN